MYNNQDSSANDAKINGSPTEAVTSLKWNYSQNGANMLAASSWDGKVYVYEVQANNNMIGGMMRANHQAEDAPLSISWAADGSKIFFGGCDNKVSAWDLGSNQAQPFGQHNAPVKSVVFLAEMNMAISGSWDQTIKFWDFRSNGPIFTLSYNHKILALECAGPLMVAGFSDRQLAHYNLAKLPQMGQSFREEKMYESPFKNQIRCLSIFSEKNGYAAGSTEGRCAIKYVDLNQQTYVQSKEDFAFKCHRVGASQNTSQPQEVYSVNSIAFAGRHPHSFATAGSDGNFIFWDKNAKSKLKGFGRKPNPVVATHFDMNSNLFAYALAYDWSRGASGYCKQDNNTVGIYLHATPDEEIRPKRK